MKSSVSGKPHAGIDGSSKLNNLKKIPLLEFEPDTRGVYTVQCTPTTIV